MLRIKNPEKSLRFYKEGFGLRTIFTFNTGLWTSTTPLCAALIPPTSLTTRTVYYLGHPNHATESSTEMISTLGTRKGLLELYHVPHDVQASYATGNEPGALGFGHVGFTVPDVAAALERLRKVVPELEIIKPLGEAEFGGMGVPGKDGREQDIVEEGYKAVFRQLAFVKDPDGYWVELVPEVVV